MLRHARADWQLHILPLSSFECSCGDDLLNTLLTFPVSVSVGEMLGSQWVSITGMEAGSPCPE